MLNSPPSPMREIIDADVVRDYRTKPDVGKPCCMLMIHSRISSSIGVEAMFRISQSTEGALLPSV